jgi:hypothetical protein
MGTEEYVHMKSLEDEYECMESTMPNKGREQGREEEEQGREEEEQGREEEEQRREEEEQTRGEEEQSGEAEQEVAGMPESYNHSSEDQGRDTNLYKDPHDKALGLDIPGTYPHESLYRDEINDSDNIDDNDEDFIDEQNENNFKKNSRNHLFDPPSPEYKKNYGENEEIMSEKSEIDDEKIMSENSAEDDRIQSDSKVKGWDSEDID